MVQASTHDDSQAESTLERGESRLTALARDLIEAVGVEGAMRYCSSLGWQGVLEEVESLRRQEALAE